MSTPRPGKLYSPLHKEDRYLHLKWAWRLVNPMPFSRRRKLLSGKPTDIQRHSQGFRRKHQNKKRAVRNRMARLSRRRNRA